MRGWRSALCAMLWLGATAVSAAEPGRPANLAQIDALIGSAKRAEAAQALETLIASAEFRSYSDQARYDVFRRLGSVRLELGQGPAALAMFKAAIATSRATPEDWASRAAAAIKARDSAELISTVQTLATTSPAMLNRLSARDVEAGAGVVAQGVPAQQKVFDLMSVLRVARWSPNDPVGDVDGLWLTHTLALVERNDLPAAKEAALRIRSPFNIIAMRADRRFDPITQQDVSQFDPVAAANRRLADLRGGAAARPDRLEVVYSLADALVWLGRIDEALGVLDAALARAQPTGGAPSPYTDIEAQLPRVMQNRAAVLAYLGRADEAVVQMEAATALSAPDGADVMLFRLADFYQELGRPKDTLATLDRIPPKMLVGGPGSFVLVQRICAYAQLGDKAAYQRAMVQLRKSPARAGGAAVGACTGDVAAFATMLRQQLLRPEGRERLLVTLQTYRQPPAQSAWSRGMTDVRNRALTRADVQNALAQAGRIETYDLVRF